jgi:hypothetical protein
VKRWLPVLGVVALVVLAWVASSLSSPQVTNVPLPSFSGAPPTLDAHHSRGPSLQTPEQNQIELPLWPLWIVVGLLGLVLGAVLIALVIAFLQGRQLRKKARLYVDPVAAAPLQALPVPDEVIAAVDESLEQLSDTDADPRRAVIACWLRLEQLAADAGTPRGAGDSPTELVARLLSAHRVSRAALDGLTVIYHEARYATRPIGEQERATALSALRLVRSELAAELQPGEAAGE